MVTHSDIGCYIDTQELVFLLRAKNCNAFQQKKTLNIRGHGLLYLNNVIGNSIASNESDLYKGTHDKCMLHACPLVQLEHHVVNVISVIILNAP